MLELTADDARRFRAALRRAGGGDGARPGSVACIAGHVARSLRAWRGDVGARLRRPGRGAGAALVVPVEAIVAVAARGDDARLEALAGGRVRVAWPAGGAS